MKTRKTAGSSIQKALSTICGPDDIITPDAESPETARNVDKFVMDHPHPPIGVVKDFIGEETWNKFFKFAFVRNPWSLAVSRYHWNKRGVDCSVEDFNNFLAKYCSDEAHWGPAHYYVNDLQQNYITVDENVEVNFIGKLETLKDDFKTICSKLNLPMLKLTRSKGEYKPKRFNHYTEYYNDDTRTLIERYFSTDINMFEYTYDEKITARRIKPIITSEMLSKQINDNINGPSLIKVPEWVEHPLGKYYLYFAHHQGKHIRMAYADNVDGPYTVHEPGTLQLNETTCKTHIASPDVHIDERSGRIAMYYHGDTVNGQKTFISWSIDGIKFLNNVVPKGEFYFRVFRYKDKFYAMAKNKNIDGIIYESDDWDGKFKPLYNLIPNIRHSAVYVDKNTLFLFYSLIGDAPESILVTAINLDNWEPLSTQRILQPRTKYEGAHLPAMKSMPGSSTLRYGGPVNELRDPCIYEESGNLYLLYSLAGEYGIGLAQLYVAS